MDWMEHPQLEKFVHWIVGIFILDIVVLNIIVFGIFLKFNDIKKTPTTTLTLTAKQNDEEFRKEILKVIEEATASAKPAREQESKRTKEQVVNFSKSPNVKEFYIPVGTASFYSVNDWGTVPGAQVSIDSGNFNNVKSVTFEASVHVPNASEDVWVRLYNDTDKRAIPNSDLFFPSSTTTNSFVSGNITLDPGIKTYKVQIKTQFSTPASLDQSRIHIVIN